MLADSAQKVQDVLKQKGINARVVEFPASTRTAADAAHAIGCTVAQIVKSLVFCTQQTQKSVLILVSGPNRVDEKLLAQIIGEPISRANADFVKQVTGFAIGGVPPVGHAQKIDTYIDQDLLKLTELWAAAGTPNAVFNLKPDELVRITGGRVIQVC